jgi:hypothetical protein
LHWHDHEAGTAHKVTPTTETTPPLHAHEHKTAARKALLLIPGSSPMVEGIPAFFAASRFGVAVIVFMAIVFAASTIVTYVVLCVYSAAGLQRVKLGPLERYSEVFTPIQARHHRRNDPNQQLHPNINGRGRRRNRGLSFAAAGVRVSIRPKRPAHAGSRIRHSGRYQNIIKP